MEQHRLFLPCLLLMTLQSLVAGACINLKQCPAAVKYITDIRNNVIHISDAQVLRDAQCGTANNREPNVDCEKIPSCYQPTDPNYCVKARDCCVALRLISYLNGTQDNDIKKKLRESACNTGGADKKIKCSSLLKLEESLLKVPPGDDFCVTASGLKGRCIPWQACRTFTEKPKTRNYLDYFRRSICDKVNQKVCCGAEENIDNVCGLERGETFIAGGTETKPNEFPWVVLLKYTDPSVICGGNLINSQFVLTAAHCVRPDLVKIRIAGNSHRNILEYNVISKRAHEKYRPAPLTYDIALLRIQKVSYSDRIRWICLPPEGYNDLPTEYLIVGNGFTENDTLSESQLKASIPKTQSSVCEEMYRSYFDSYYDNIICAGGRPGVDACPGDSGGPLMAKVQNISWHLYGIVSGGKGPCSDGIPGVYTRVDRFLHWIRTNMKQML